MDKETAKLAFIALLILAILITMFINPYLCLLLIFMVGLVGIGAWIRKRQGHVKKVNN